MRPSPSPFFRSSFLLSFPPLSFTVPFFPAVSCIPPVAGWPNRHPIQETSRWARGHAGRGGSRRVSGYGLPIGRGVPDPPPFLRPPPPSRLWARRVRGLEDAALPTRTNRQCGRRGAPIHSRKTGAALVRNGRGPPEAPLNSPRRPSHRGERTATPLALCGGSARLLPPPPLSGGAAMAYGVRSPIPAPPISRTRARRPGSA